MLHVLKILILEILEANLLRDILNWNYLDNNRRIL